MSVIQNQYPILPQWAGHGGGAVGGRGKAGVARPPLPPGYHQCLTRCGQILPFTVFKDHVPSGTSITIDLPS